MLERLEARGSSLRASEPRSQRRRLRGSIPEEARSEAPRLDPREGGSRLEARGSIPEKEARGSRLEPREDARPQRGSSTPEEARPQRGSSTPEKDARPQRKLEARPQRRICARRDDRPERRTIRRTLDPREEARSQRRRLEAPRLEARSQRRICARGFKQALTLCAPVLGHCVPPGSCGGQPADRQRWHPSVGGATSYAVRRAHRSSGVRPNGRHVPFRLAGG